VSYWLPPVDRGRSEGTEVHRATATVWQRAPPQPNRAAPTSGRRRFITGTAPTRGDGAPGSGAPSPSGHLLILVTRPAPTVRPPSRMAKRRPCSMAMGWISATVICVSSPGMTISVPSGNVMTPVTSVVRK